MKYSKILRAALVAGAVLSLTACGHIQKEISSEADMLDKAEFATGIDARNLRIVEGSVSGSIDSVNYKVKAKNGQVYRCYFTSALAVTSDAICTPIDKDGKASRSRRPRPVPTASATTCCALPAAAEKPEQSCKPGNQARTKDIVRAFSLLPQPKLRRQNKTRHFPGSPTSFAAVRILFMTLPKA